MTKIIKVKDGTYLAIDTEYDNIEDYLASVPTQDYEDVNYFCPGLNNYSKPTWYPIEGAEFVDCEVIEKTDSVIPEVYSDIETKTLYLEHINDMWNIIDDNNVVFGMWDDIAFNQNKINRIIKKVEEGYSVKVELKFKLEDMTVNELRNRLNKNQKSIQALEAEDEALVDECLNDIQALIKEECKNSDDVKHELRFAKHYGCIHNYHLEGRRLIARKVPLVLEEKALIDRLFSMIEAE